MNRGEEIRPARWRLAQVLAGEEDGLTEAREQLELLLTVAGPEPPDWQVHTELGRLALAAEEPAAALRSYLHAVLTAPPFAAGESARLALPLLDDVPPESAGAALTSVDLDELGRRAAEPDAPGSLVRLATGVLMLNGQPEQALALLHAKPTRGLPAADEQRTQEAVAHIGTLIDDDRWDDALAAFEEAGLGDHPGYADLRGLLLYANDRTDEAWAVVDGTSPHSIELIVLRVLVLLRRAAAESGSTRRETAEQALAAATDAVQLEPTRPETSLLRAEVMLEGTLDPEEGRRLLRGAARRLKEEPDAFRWWRAQEQVRTDEVYAYFRIEVAAARRQDDEVISRAAAATRATTDYVQDGATAELDAAAKAARDDREGAVAAYRTAATAFVNANSRGRAIRAYRAAAELGAPAGNSLDLVELLYEASFPASRGGDGDESAAAEGLRLLEAAAVEVTDGEAVRACFLVGTMLGRASEPVVTWQALPFLLAATLAEDLYVRSANLALALGKVRLHRPATHFAELSVAQTAQPPEWVHETAIVARFNWGGRFDKKIEEWLSSMDPAPWHDALRGYAYLLTDERTLLTPLIEKIDFGDLWARLVKAHAVVRCRTYAESVPVFSSVLAAATGTHETEAAVDAAIALGNVDTAREQLAENATTGEMSAHLAASWAAVIDLVDGIPSSAELADRLLAEAVRPFDLLAFGRAQLPTLIAATDGRTPLTRELIALQDTCITTAESLPDDPPLTVELDAGQVRCPDSDLSAVIETMLHAAQRVRDGDRRSAAAELRGISYLPRRGAPAFRHTLALAVDHLSRRSDGEDSDARR